MSRDLSAGYQAHLDGELQQRALCVKVTRADGEVLGFTTFDEDLNFGAVTYEAEAAVEASDLRAAVGTGVDNLEALGALQSGQITAVDVLAGLYDGARVELFEVCWSDTSLGRLIYLTGKLGEWTIDDPGQFKSEIRSLAQALAQQIVEQAQPTCRVKHLFDERCFVGGANYDATFTADDFRSSHTVATVDSLTQLTFAANTQASGYYEYGRVEFTSGANDGLQRDVKEHTLSGGQAVITLQESFPFTVQVGDTALLEAGCDRTLAVCRDRFANVGNLRGEPHLPGTDAILVRGRR